MENRFTKEEVIRITKCVQDPDFGLDVWTLGFIQKIEIKDEFGNILKLFDGADGCDFCEGSGKDPFDNECGFCSGKGRIGWAPCKNCKGEKRILGKQKLQGIKFLKDEKSHRVESMGHFDKFQMGMVGQLWLVKSDPS
jgi:hypothetical protein